MAGPDWDQLLAFAEVLGDGARALARRWFRTATAELKGDRTPVTEADREIEQALRARIRAAFPDHGIRGEEQEPERADAELCWVLDPIDGTKAFASGNPMFGTLIGLAWRGVPVLGVLEAPALGERWSAAPGRGTLHQGEPVAVRPPRPLGQAVLYCTTPDRVSASGGYAALRQRVAYAVYGGDCIAYGILARGGCDLIVDTGMKLHDFCALVPIVERAGGWMRDWQGRPLTLQSDGAVIAASCADLGRQTEELLRR
jgi:inositol-phosphate phosphatase/L-galactose 1-phosphate phosphatase/histidinol-phosphatase